MRSITAFLQNKAQPEHGWAEIDFPAAEENLNSMLAKISIFPCNSSERNLILSLPDDLSPFSHIKDELVNADELNFLAMRLDSFDGYEMTQFHAAAHCKNITDIEGLINLTFNIDNYTVVTDFSDMKAIGKRFYLDKHNSVSAEEFNKVNTADIGYNLLRNGNGTITPFGVAYEHGKETKLLYKGTTFPQYKHVGDSVMLVGLTSPYENADHDSIAWLNLPVPDTVIDKALNRLEVFECDVCMTHIHPDDIPDGIVDRLNLKHESIRSLNEMCRAIAAVKLDDCPKINAACEFAEVYTARDIKTIVENLQFFKHYPEISDIKEYGYKIAEDAGAFQYSQELSEYVDFEALGESRMEKEYGRILECGYTVFTKSPEMLDELLKTEQNGAMTMI